MNKNTAPGDDSNFDSVKSHNHKIAENSTTVEPEFGIILILDFCFKFHLIKNSQILLHKISHQLLVTTWTYRTIGKLVRFRAKEKKVWYCERV